MQNKRFGDYLRYLRKRDGREITLSKMAEILGISVNYMSDVEINRRKPFGADKIKILKEYLLLDRNEVTTLYELAGKERSIIPADIETIILDDNIGSMARMALRETNAGNATEEDWKALIRIIEERKKIS